MTTFIKAGFWETLCAKCTGYKGWLNLDQFVNSKIPAPTYKVYTALLTRTGATAPAAAVLENTLGTITYSYTTLGVYSINSSNLFPQNKTVAFVQQQGNGAFGNTLNIVLLNEDTIRLVQATSSGSNNVDWSSPVSIEIRVYN